MILAAAAMILVVACREMDPSTYHELFFRVATVRYDGTKAWLDMDYSGEVFTIDNFRTSADMANFNVSNGDRIIASLSFDAVGDMSNNTVTLNEIRPLGIMKLEEAAPSDTMNFYYQFSKFLLINVQYPAIWAAGHIVNVAPVYFVPEADCKAEFHFYPIEVIKDTLVLRLYSDIPDDDKGLNPDYTQSILCCDVSSLRERVSNAAEQEKRDTILARLDRQNLENIIVTVTTPNTLRAKDSKNPDSDYLQPIPNLSKSVTVPFDF